eukprot:CAMPEP_0119550532 /NCGR_PEP_ID=MMETSP1352-20130426/4036_1 /TAXON_ID=265584 /ORGANISM="Stauroneis constricta, Strain CCMP1120" /LENGTH=958 /DNA_ID=CAMNT_0007596419 /DNA_START=242 /DNA_END=3118 /DNA_ORIENTATION=+
MTTRGSVSAMACRQQQQQQRQQTNRNEMPAQAQASTDDDEDNDAHSGGRTTLQGPASRCPDVAPLPPTGMVVVSTPASSPPRRQSDHKTETNSCFITTPPASNPPRSTATATSAFTTSSSSLASPPTPTSAEERGHLPFSRPTLGSRRPDDVDLLRLPPPPPPKSVHQFPHGSNPKVAMNVCTPSPQTRHASRGRKRNAQCLAPVGLGRLAGAVAVHAPRASFASNGNGNTEVAASPSSSTISTPFNQKRDSSNVAAGAAASVAAIGNSGIDDDDERTAVFGMEAPKPRTPMRNHTHADRFTTICCPSSNASSLQQTPNREVRNAFHTLSLQSPAKSVGSLRSIGSSFSAFQSGGGGGRSPAVHSNASLSFRPTSNGHAAAGGSFHASPRICQVRLIADNGATPNANAAGTPAGTPSISAGFSGRTFTPNSSRPPLGSGRPIGILPPAPGSSVHGLLLNHRRPVPSSSSSSVASPFASVRSALGDSNVTSTPTHGSEHGRSMHRQLPRRRLHLDEMDALSTPTFVGREALYASPARHSHESPLSIADPGSAASSTPIPKARLAPRSPAVKDSTHLPLRSNWDAADRSARRSLPMRPSGGSNPPQLGFGLSIHAPRVAAAAPPAGAFLGSREDHVMLPSQSSSSSPPPTPSMHGMEISIQRDSPSKRSASNTPMSSKPPAKDGALDASNRTVGTSDETAAAPTLSPWAGPFGIKCKSLLAHSTSNSLLKELASEQERRKAETADVDSLTDSDDEDGGGFILKTPGELAQDSQMNGGSTVTQSTAGQRNSIGSHPHGGMRESYASLVGTSFVHGSMTSMDFNTGMLPSRVSSSNNDNQIYNHGRMVLGYPSDMHRNSSMNSLGSIGLALDNDDHHRNNNANDDNDDDNELPEQLSARDLVTPPAVPMLTDVPTSPPARPGKVPNVNVCISRADPNAVNMTIAKMVFDANATPTTSSACNV